MASSEKAVKTVHVTAYTQGNAFEDGLLGVNTEITRKGYFGGLSAQLLNNRKFFAGDQAPAGWDVSGETAAFITDREEESLCRSNFIDVRNGCLSQTSQYSRLKQEDTYEVKIWAKAISESAELTVLPTSAFVGSPQTSALHLPAFTLEKNLL